MKNVIAYSFIAALAFGLAIPATSALADDNKGQRDKVWHSKDQKRDSRDRSILWLEEAPESAARIRHADRAAIRAHLLGSYQQSCPPGLAKKNTACIPPGMAKRYAVGQNLPADVFFFPPPAVLLKKIYPAPAGYKYVQADNDILLVNIVHGTVMDAVTLSSALHHRG